MQHRHHTMRGLAFVLALLTTAGGVVALSAAPASAGPCGSVSGEWTHPDGVAKVSYGIWKPCDSATAYVSGYLYDILCDNRAVALVVGYGPTGAGSGNPDKITNGNGCGSRVEFAVDGYVTEWGVGVTLELWAYNTWGRSAKKSTTVYFPT